MSRIVGVVVALVLAPSACATGPTIRADFAPADVVVVAFAPQFDHALTAVVHGATGAGAEVVMLLGSGYSREEAEAWLARRALHATLLEAGVDSPWVRDYGPFVRDDGTWVDARYVGGRPGDDALPAWLAARYHVTVESIDAEIDGGVVISDGDGTCAATRAVLPAALGCRRVLVVPPIAGEETGHVDLIAQFIAPGVVAVADDQAEALRVFREAGMTVVALPRRYVNFTRVGARLLVPDYATEDPGVAWAALRRALPGVRLVPVAADVLAAQGGSVHCITLTLCLALGACNE